MKEGGFSANSVSVLLFSCYNIYFVYLCLNEYIYNIYINIYNIYILIYVLFLLYYYFYFVELYRYMYIYKDIHVYVFSVFLLSYYYIYFVYLCIYI